MRPSEKPAPDRGETPATSLRRAIPLAIVLTCGVAFSAVAALVVRHQERARFENEFDRQTQIAWRTLRVSIREYEECLHTLRDLFNSSDDVTAEEFRRTAADLRTRHSGLELLGWLPRVTSADRAAFDAKAARTDGVRFVIHETPKVDESLPTMPSPDRAEYLPMLYCDPLVGNETMFGFDHLRGPYRETLDRALATGLVASTQRVTIGEDYGMEPGWAMALPVFHGASEPTTAAERREKLRGVVSGAMTFSGLIAGMIETMPGANFDVVLIDDAAEPSERFLAGFVGGKFRALDGDAGEEFRVGTHRVLAIPVGGRPWIALFRPTTQPAFLYPWAFLGGGMALTGMLTALLYSAQRRTLTVQTLVGERTAELHATQRALHEDNQRRRKAEERYRAFVEQSSEAIWRFELTAPYSVDLPEDEQLELYYGRAFLAEANDACAQMYGFDRAKEMIGMSLADLMPREPSNLEHLRRYVRSGYRLANDESHEIGRDGQRRIFLNNITGIVENGLLVRAWGTQRDVTEQRRAEEDRQRAEVRLRSALAAADLGTWEWDVESDSIAWSETTEEIFGFERGGFRGGLNDYLALVHPDHRPLIRARLEQVAQDGGSLSGELRIIRRDGSVRWVASRGDVVRNEHGKIIRLVGAVMDVTEQHAAAEEKAQIEQRLQETQKLESLGILAGGVAHDFNNLLTGILGNTSLARMDLPETSPVQIYLEAIEKTSRRAAELCKQMLAYSGKGRFVVQRLDLSEIVEDTAQLVRPSISRNAVVEFHLARNLPAISADATQMRQIIMNLVINASDALGENAGTITLSTGVLQADAEYLANSMFSPPPGEYVFLEIQDTGCGMSRETMTKIFNPFFTTKFTGRGLGLAAVLGIVRGHGGTLKVSSGVGKGSTFRLLLPSAGAPVELHPTESATDAEWLGSGTLLVVDDEASVRAVAARSVETFGYSAITAASGGEAVRVLEAAPGKFAGVLLDLTMPQMDGLQVFGEMRRIRPDLPVVLMSGYNEQDAISRFAGQGLAAFVQKPFTPSELRRAFRRITTDVRQATKTPPT